MKEINECHKIFLSFKNEFQNYLLQDLTESDTRSKIIDVIFTDILDWDENQINREGHTVTEYYDYLFTIPGFKFIVEAKRDFKKFTLPNKHKILTIGTLDKDNKDVVLQIRQYLFEVGLQYAVITNGHQFIIGKFFNTDGSDWKTNKCIIFNGFDDIDERFTTFFNILSKTSVSESSGFSVHLEESVQKEGKTILATLSEKDAELVRNSLSSELTPIIDNLFGELNNIDDSINNELTKECFKECFIENKEIKKNRSEIEKLFADTPPQLEHVIPARNTDSVVKQINNEIKNDELKFNEIPPNPIIIIGSKGAGKTTFINYLFSNSNYTEQSHPYIYVDFRKYADLQNNFTDQIYAEILEQVYEKYNQIELSTIKTLRSIYHREIKRNDAGIWNFNLKNNKSEYKKELSSFLSEQQKNNETHFLRISEHLIKSRRVRLCVIIDNADQFEIEIQKKVFLFAQSINRKGKVTIIISLREGYYYQLRQFPPFDAFACNVYHITAPPYKDVLQKRINYALSQLELKGKSKGNVGDKIFTIEKDNVRTFLLGIKSTLFGNNNSEILNFIQETTYPNIREGLEIFKQFLISGHTEVSAYILRYQQTEDTDKSLVIPYWEFIKAVGLNNKNIIITISV
jgi:GTPase SAR1 family protein